MSGVILFDETIRSTGKDGASFVETLTSRGVIRGIKVDAGVVALPGSPEETTTAGLDGLGKRCAEYYAMGARFAKWRAVLKIDVAKGFPSAGGDGERQRAGDTRRCVKRTAWCRSWSRRFSWTAIMT